MPKYRVVTAESLAATVTYIVEAESVNGARRQVLAGAYESRVIEHAAEEPKDVIADFLSFERMKA